MIVAPIQGERKTALADIKKAEKKGFMAVEFRYDKLEDPDLEVSAWERLMSLKLRAAMTFFAIEEGKTSAKGQPTIDRARAAADALGIDISPYLRR